MGPLFGQVLDPPLVLVTRRYPVSPNDDTLITLSALHEVVRIVGDGKDVRRQLADLLVLVAFDVLLTVDGEDLVRVDGHQDAASERLMETSREYRNSMAHTVIPAAAISSPNPGVH